MLVVNFLSGPCTGKSTITPLVIYKLKMAGINCEYVPEFAKDLTWEERKTINNQPYILGEQYRRLDILRNKVDVAITDTSLLLSIIYDNKFKTILPFTLELFHSFDNLIYFMARHSDIKYTNDGRQQDLITAQALDKQIYTMLKENYIPHRVLCSIELHANIVVDDVIKKLEGKYETL